MMNDIVIRSEINLAGAMWDMFNGLDVESIACIANYYTIKELLSSLILVSGGDIELNEIDLHEDMDEEYILVIDNFGVWVYYLKVNDRYALYEDDIVFIADGCDPEVLNANINNDSDIFFFSYEEGLKEEVMCNGDCCDCVNCTEKLEEENADDEMQGFQFSFSNEFGTSNYSFYSTDKDIVEKMRADLSRIFKR